MFIYKLHQAFGGSPEKTQAPMASSPPIIRSVSRKAILVLAATLAGMAPAHADFTLLMRDLTGGSDGNPNSATEAETILALAAPNATYAYTDHTQSPNPATVNVASGGSFSPTNVLPNGASAADTYVVQATANLVIPAGDWTIAFGSDDGGKLQIPGVTFLANTGSDAGSTFSGDEIRFEGTRGHDWTMGTFTVASDLTTTIEAVMFESGGGDSFEVALFQGHTTTKPASAGWALLQDGQYGWTVQVAPINDPDPPVIAALDPADNATGAYPGADLIATFNENIALTGSGTITITDLTDGSDIRTINLPDARVSVSNDTLTINPTTNLEFSTEYEITIDGSVLQDIFSTPNAYGGTASGEWTFTTAAQDLTAPVITNLAPADNAIGVATNSASVSLVATFDDNIIFGSGNITLVDVTSGTDTRIISIGDPRLSIADNVLTISPATNLTNGVEYAVQIGASAIINYSDVSFAGIADTTTWSFTTQAGQDGVWTLNGNGNWNTLANWNNGAGPIAGGVGSTADFSQTDLTGHRTVTVDTNVTVGTMLFGDSNAQQDYTINKEASGSLTFDSGVAGLGGTSYLTINSGRDTKLYSGFVLNDQLEIARNSGGLQLQGTISGNGGITGTNGFIDLRNATLSYSGDTIIDNGATIQWAHTGNESPSSKIIIKNGIYQRYYKSTLSTSLGTGPKQIQIQGGNSGFSGGSLNVNLNGSGSTLVWGSTYFKPDKFMLGGGTATGVGHTKINNRLDLNGQTRIINVFSHNDSGYAQINGVIADDTDTPGTGIIKEGPGRLLLAHANTFTGPVQIKGGFIQVANASGLGAQTNGGLSFIEGGTVLELGSNVTVSSLSSTVIYYGTISNVTANDLILTVDQDMNTTYAGVIDDGYNLGTTGITKTGTGTLTFPFDEELGYGVASHHSGPTLVNEGAVIMDADWDAAFSDVTVAAGASFGGKGQMAGDLTLADGAKLFFDPAETLTCNGFSVDLGNLSVAKLVLHGAATVPDDTYLVITGSATIDTSTVENLGAENAGTFDGKYGYFNINTDGDLELVVSATDPADTSSYAGWKSFHGLSGSSANDDADDDGDGIPLLLEYALGGDPGVASRGILPTRQYTDDAGNTYLELVVTRPIGLTGVNYIVQTDTTLSSWPVDSTGVILFSTTDLGNGTETLVYRRAAAVSTSARAFIRLKVTAN